MVAFLSRLFGRTSEPASQAAPPPQPDEPVEYKGFSIRAAPEQEGSQWRVAGVIAKQDREGEERRFLRADCFPTRDEAAAFAVVKAKQIINERGESLFSETAPGGRV